MSHALEPKMCAVIVYVCCEKLIKTFLRHKIFICETVASSSLSIVSYTTHTCRLNTNLLWNSFGIVHACWFLGTYFYIYCQPYILLVNTANTHIYNKERIFNLNGVLKILCTRVWWRANTKMGRSAKHTHLSWKLNARMSVLLRTNKAPYRYTYYSNE